MRELHNLLKYIDEYIFVPEYESVIIRHGTNAERAEELYHKALGVVYAELDNDDDEKSDAASISAKDILKWEFDIAIDSVRLMTGDDRSYILKHMWTGEYYFGYALDIRNKYMHVSEKYHRVEPDHASCDVIMFIFSIISPIYDYRYENCIDYYENTEYQKLVEMYGEKEDKIFSEVEKRLAKEQFVRTAFEALNLLREKLIDKLSHEEFVCIFKEFISDNFQNGFGWGNDIDDQVWENQFTEMAVLFPREANQVIWLRKMGIFYDIERGRIKSIDDCKLFIDNKIGLKEDYALFIAKCIWETCSPYADNSRSFKYFIEKPGESKHELLPPDYNIIKEGSVEQIVAHYASLPKDEAEKFIRYLPRKTLEKIIQYFEKLGID